MTIHIDYDREDNRIESILASQTKMISTLNGALTWNIELLEFKSQWLVLLVCTKKWWIMCQKYA